MDIMTPEEWNNENYPYPNCRSILHNGREMEKRMKEYSEYVLRESQKTETSDEALPIGDVAGQSEQLADHQCKPMVNADWTYLKCKCGKRFELKG